MTDGLRLLRTRLSLGASACALVAGCVLLTINRGRGCALAGRIDRLPPWALGRTDTENTPKKGDWDRYVSLAQRLNCESPITVAAVLGTVHPDCNGLGRDWETLTKPRLLVRLMFVLPHEVSMPVFWQDGKPHACTRYLDRGVVPYLYPPLPASDYDPGQEYRWMLRRFPLREHGG